jgi:phosphoglycerate kinase
MQKEMDMFLGVLSKPQRPFLAILGGSKVSDKVKVIYKMLDQVDEMIIGGGMAYTFKKVLEGVDIGGSLFEADSADECRRIVEKARERGVRLHFPVDHVIADHFSADARIGITDDKVGIPDGWMALALGPPTRAPNWPVIARAKTVLWNGPLGVFELGPFATGTLSAFWQLVDATKTGGACTIIGGGDTGAASKQFYVGTRTVADQVTHVSTGGGSSLVLMEGKALPGIEALTDKVKPPVV